MVMNYFQFDTEFLLLSNRLKSMFPMCSTNEPIFQGSNAMFGFHDLEAKFGEVVAQAILENLERYEGVRSSVVSSLEERWDNLMHDHAGQRLAA